MEFFLIGYPDHNRQRNYWAPTDLASESMPVRLPAIRCDQCGRTRTSLERYPDLILPESTGITRKLLRSGPVAPREFQELCDLVRKELGIPRDFVLPPGARLGRARVAFRRTVNLPDVVWHGVPIILVSAKVRERFAQARLTGYSTAPVEIVIPEGTDPGETGEYQELVIHGSAGRAVTNPEFGPVTLCTACGAEKFGKLTYVQVSEQQWDCTDLCRFDGAPRHRLISANGKRVLDEANIHNVLLRPLGQLA